MHASTNLPAIEAADPVEVALALESARASWARGEPLEAVRFIQRAAEGAEATGDDLRAVSLARAAADLRAEVSVASEPPGPMNEGAALSPYDDFSEKTIVDSPATSVARQALQTSVQIAGARQAVVTLVASVAEASAAAASAIRHEAVRVALIQAVQQGGLLTVRVLSAHEKAPPGCREALLVGLDPSTRLIAQ